MAAGPDEVRAALEALSPAALLRLRSYAQWRIKGLGRAALDRRHEDLLHEAFLAVLDGSRRWDPAKVGIVGLLVGAMRSISSHWREGFDEGQPHLESEVRSVEAWDGPLDRVASEQPGPERKLAAQGQLAAIHRLFEGDLEVLFMIEAMAECMSGQEVASTFESGKRYEAALKRLRRGVRKAFGKGGHT